jgi:hypothetical protein
MEIQVILQETLLVLAIMQAIDVTGLSVSIEMVQMWKSNFWNSLRTTDFW